jgi:hypothetical protein
MTNEYTTMASGTQVSCTDLSELPKECNLLPPD